jgi:O-antigen/teichoic acid export membrane protein
LPLLFPGITDAGLSSAAGFLTGIYAARYLDAETLGAYALYFTAAGLAGLLPQDLIHAPTSVAVLKHEPANRLSIVQPTLLRTIPFSLIAALAVMLPGIIVSNEVALSTLIAFSVTSFFYTLISPLQDFVRGMFHLSGTPMRAAVTSAAQLLFVCIAIPALVVAGVPDPWIPFGSLAIANYGSTSVGLVLVRGIHGPSADMPPLGEILRSGRTLLPSDLLPQGSIFLSSAIVASLASAAALGQVTAAQFVARPIVVLALGLNRAFRPRLMEAGFAGSRSQALRSSYVILAIMLSTGALYTLFAGWTHPLNPMSSIVPVAYEAKGLALFVLLSTTVFTTVSMFSAIFIGASENGALLFVTAIGSSTRVLIVLGLAASLGAYALPTSAVVNGSILLVLGLFLLRRVLTKA